MWGVPIDHEYFKTTNKAQWLWYFYNNIEDKEEEFLDSRSLIEYHAGFLEPALVSKVRNERDANIRSSKGIIGTADERAFGESIKQMFGNDLNIPTRKSEDLNSSEIHHFANVADRIKKYEQDQIELKASTVPYNYKHWAEFDLG